MLFLRSSKLWRRRQALETVEGSGCCGRHGLEAVFGKVWETMASNLWRQQQALGVAASFGDGGEL